MKSWTLTSATWCFWGGLDELPRPEDRALLCCLEVIVLGVAYRVFSMRSLATRLLRPYVPWNFIGLDLD